MNPIHKGNGARAGRPEMPSPVCGDQRLSTQTGPSDAQPSAAMSWHLAMCLYNLGLLTYWPLRSWYCFLRAHCDGKYRDNLRPRTGLVLPHRLSHKQRVWFHALSVGETRSVIPLIKALKERRPQLEIIFSTTTETGQAIARKHLAAWVEVFFYLPYDLPWVMDRLVKRHMPSLFVLVETDIWPNLLRTLQRHQVPGVLVNGRLSPQSSRRMRRFGRFFAPLLQHFAYIFAQSAADGERYQELGFPEQHIRVMGNLKYDAALLEPLGAAANGLRNLTGITAERLVWIAGSTHDGEEEILLRVHEQLRVQYPDLLLILAPRHIERTSGIRALCREFGFETAMRSRGQSAAGKAVYLLDTLGELSRCYNLADVAYIGGSLVAFGGHNPIEALAQGKPTVWGPHLFNFREIEADLILAGCGRRVGSADELLEVVSHWLADQSHRKAMKNAARQFIAGHAGSSGRLAGVLDSLLTRRELYHDPHPVE